MDEAINELEQEIRRLNIEVNRLILKDSNSESLRKKKKELWDKKIKREIYRFK